MFCVSVSKAGSTRLATYTGAGYAAGLGIERDRRISHSSAVRGRALEMVPPRSHDTFG